VQPSLQPNHEVLLLEHEKLLRAKRKAFLLKVLLLIVTPTLVAAYYAYFYATPRYVSEFQIVYDDTSHSSASSGLAALLGVGATTDMTRVISAYITSGATLSLVDKKLDLRREYSNPKVDWLDRMSARASEETFLKYFQRRLAVYENTGGYLTVDVESFNPQRALETAGVINEAADAMVDDLNDRPRRDYLAFTRSELERFEKRLNLDTEMLTRFREEHSEYDYSNVVSELSTVVGTLQAQLAETRTELARVRPLLSDDAPTVRDLKMKIASLESQIQIERTRFGSPQDVSNDVSAKIGAGDSRGTQDDGSYSLIMAQYANLTLAQDLAKTDYAVAKQSYEAALLALAKKTAYVVNFVPPQLPQNAERPDGIYLVSTTLLVTVLLYYLGTLVFGLLRDQVAHH
jgi:capsular polysaccharide transport system permease protein